MHLDFSIITLTVVIASHIDRNVVRQPDSYYSSSFSIHPSYNTYELQPTVAANDRLQISRDYTLLQLGTY